jgi:dihydroflavonol-4-reductase
MDVVTGATGLLGNVLVRELLNSGRKVKVLVRKTSDIKCLEDCREKIEIIYGDLLDRDVLAVAFNGAEHVYHLASEISIMPGYNENLVKVNLEGTRNVIAACRINRVKRLIYTSTIHIFKETAKNFDGLLNEDFEIDPDHPLGLYNRTKATATLEVLMAASKELETVAVSPTAIIGPYDFRKSHLGSLIVNYCNGKQRLIIDGAYDFVDVRDVALGHILAANKGKSGQIYILSGQRMEIPDLIKTIGKISGTKKQVYKVPFWIIYPIAFVAPVYYKVFGVKPVFTTFSIKTVRSNSYFSYKKAKNELGYEPRPIEQTLKDTYFWFKENEFCS